jgi:hypothetical protein
MFSGMMQGNAKIVRIWLFPALQGIDINANPNAVTDKLVSNLVTVFTLARNCNLKLYITALNAVDAALVANPNNCPVPVPQGFPKYCPRVSTFYKNLFSIFSNPNSDATKALTSLLGPVLSKMSLNQDVIYGFDLINEIESAINAGYFSFSWFGAQAWIRNMTKFVNAYPCDPLAKPPCQKIGDWLPVTSSAGGGYAVQELTFGFFSGLGLNFYDVHIYSDMGQYSGQTWLCLRTQFVDHLPIVLGEYGQKSTCTSPTPQSTCDAIQKTATTNFLNGAKKAVFPLRLPGSMSSRSYPRRHFPHPGCHIWISIPTNTTQATETF